MGSKYRCSICSDGRSTVVDTLLAAGRTPGFIETEMKRLNTPTKAETIVRHRQRCLAGIVDNQPLLQSGLTGAGLQGDFATLVRNEAGKRLREGKLTVTAHHGLQAQSLIDRRAEKAADRDLIRNVALLMSGASLGGGAPEHLINVTPDAEYDESDTINPDGTIFRLPAPSAVGE